jgi:hypothetical protein
MVSGFFTSPKDQLLIISGDAKPILIESKTLRSISSIPSFNFFLLSVAHSALL